MSAAAARWGQHLVPRTSFPSGDFENLARYNEVAIAGSLFGSRLRVTVEADVT